jgi:hypothetical protein
MVQSNCSVEMSRIENIQAAECFDRARHQGLAKCFVANIAGDGHRFAAGLADQLEHLVRVRLLVRMIVDGHIGALACVGNRRRASHSGIAAGDERLAALEPPRAAIAFFPMVGTRPHFRHQSRPRLVLLGEGRLGIFAARILQGGLRAVRPVWRTEASVHDESPAKRGSGAPQHARCRNIRDSAQAPQRVLSAGSPIRRQLGLAVAQIGGEEIHERLVEGTMKGDAVETGISVLLGYQMPACIALPSRSGI